MAGCLSQEVEVWCGVGGCVHGIGRLRWPESTAGMRGRLGNSNKYLTDGKRDKAAGEARSMRVGTTAKVSWRKEVQMPIVYSLHR